MSAVRFGLKSFISISCSLGDECKLSLSHPQPVSGKHLDDPKPRDDSVSRITQKLDLSPHRRADVPIKATNNFHPIARDDNVAPHEASMQRLDCLMDALYISQRNGPIFSSLSRMIMELPRVLARREGRKAIMRFGEE